MIELSDKTNLLEIKDYKYSLQDVEDPNLYREIYNYTEVPKISFNHRRCPMDMPSKIWITDTTFRDGQQSVEPYTVKQIVDLFKLMSRLSGPNGIIRQTEFFIYSKKDREALDHQGLVQAAAAAVVPAGARDPLALGLHVHDLGVLRLSDDD